MMSSAWLSVLAKIRVLGTSRAAGEDLRQLVAEGADDGADLVGVDDVAVELLWRNRLRLRPAVPSACCG